MRLFKNSLLLFCISLISSITFCLSPQNTISSHQPTFFFVVDVGSTGMGGLEALLVLSSSFCSIVSSESLSSLFIPKGLHSTSGWFNGWIPIKNSIHFTFVQIWFYFFFCIHTKIQLQILISRSFDISGHNFALIQNDSGAAIFLSSNIKYSEAFELWITFNHSCTLYFSCLNLHNHCCLGFDSGRKYYLRLSADLTMKDMII